MKRAICHISLIAVFSLMVHISCKKETSCEGCSNDNKPPIALAGPDQVISLPTDSVLLNGTNSSDPDGTISSFIWTRISGPASLNIHSPASSKTSVKNLVPGVYQFELKVTDNGGLSAKDTIQVTVIDPGSPNRPPVADAGIDQTITLPVNSGILNGSASTDPDNNITAYAWTKISGPSSFSINNAGTVQAQITNLVAGVYQFELKVTDAGGLFDRDTVQVQVATVNPPLNCDNSNRPVINAQLIPIGPLSQARIDMAAAAAGNKIVFAGGMQVQNNSWAPTSRVDIYDIVANTWSTAELCVGRYSGIGAAANGNKIFFGGGEIGDGTWPVDSVDIYDVATNTWTVSHLSCAGNSIEGGTIGNKVVFVGGDPGFAGRPGVDRTRQIDIYDLTAGLWSAIQLSHIRAVSHHQVVAVNNKIFFSGFIGNSNADIQPSNMLEVYDFATGTWSVDNLQVAKSPSAGIAIGNKIFWVDVADHGLIQGTCLVEIRDVVTNTSSIHYLHKPAMSPVVVVKDSKVLVFRTWGNDRDRFDIYDTVTGLWSIGVLPQPIPEWSSIISVDNVVYIAGGSVNVGSTNLVWKLVL